MAKSSSTKWCAVEQMMSRARVKRLHKREMSYITMRVLQHPLAVHWQQSQKVQKLFEEFF